MRVLLIGENGQVGHELLQMLGARARVATQEKPIDFVAPSRSDLDLADLASVRNVIDEARPDVIVNAAAYNEVDAAEHDEAGAFRINRDAVAELGVEASRRRTALITYSTDFVFDGTKTSPYVETDPSNPLSVYGASKLAGEKALDAIGAPALVLRTAWVYSLRRKSFVSSILKLARERAELKVVADQLGSPTYAVDLAAATLTLLSALQTDPHGIATERRGVYHLAGSGSCSRFTLARAALEIDPFRDEHKLRILVPVPAAEYLLRAPRPLYSALECGKIRRQFGIELPDWHDALTRALSTGS